jgi:hypothetical protein
MVWRIVRATMVNIRGKVYRRLGSDETACTPVGAPQPAPKSPPSRHRINLLGSLERQELGAAAYRILPGVKPLLSC